MGVIRPLPVEENSGHGCATVYGRQQAIGKESNEFPTVGKHDYSISPIVRETRHRKFIPGVVAYNLSGEYYAQIDYRFLRSPINRRIGEQSIMKGCAVGRYMSIYK